MSAISERPVTIAMLALGGQGGGVLSGWLVDLAEANGWLAQSTYVAGVAQRTGATVYCVEMMPRAAVGGRTPVFAQYPVPGDVDIVIASELAETGRAIEKGFVTPNVTTLIASSHRDYAIGEKTALGDGIVDLGPVIVAAREAARRFVLFDMAARARETSSVISAVILGAIAGSGALPFQREQYEAVIRASGRAVHSNLAGFAAGFEGAANAQHEELADAADPMPAAVPQGTVGEAVAARIRSLLPADCRNVALHGALRALAYQDGDYAALYLDRLARIHALDRGVPDTGDTHALTRAVARELALQMCYEDTIRVAEIKTRMQRLDGIGKDIGAAPGQPWYVTEYFHPRFEEMCDTLPAGLGARALASERARRWTAPLFRKGRNVSTNKVLGYSVLSLLARLRRWRRGTLRYAVQQQRIEDWLDAVAKAAADDYEGGVALAESIEIVRGYGDTYERGLARYHAMLAASADAPAGDRSSVLRHLHRAALADEEGTNFEKALREVTR